MKKEDILKAAYGTAGVLENLVTLVRCYGGGIGDVLSHENSGHQFSAARCAGHSCVIFGNQRLLFS